MQKIKLTERQKEIVKLLRTGHDIHYSLSTISICKNLKVKHWLNPITLRSLVDKGLVKQGETLNSFYLTDLGKTISID